MVKLNRFDKLIYSLFALVILYAVVLTVILKDIAPSRLPSVMAYLLIISVMTAVAFMYKPTEEKKSFAFDVKIFFMTFLSAFFKKEGVSH